MNRSEWAEAFLTQAKRPVTPENVIAIVTWIISEGSNALNNPLDTEMPWPNSSLYNPQGVRNYDTLQDGLDATSQTLYNGYYPEILACLENANNADQTVAAIAASPWGSKPTEAMLSEVRGNMEATFNITVNTTGGHVQVPTEEPMPGPVDSPTGQQLSAPIVDACAYPTGGDQQGYWMVGADGAVYSSNGSKYYGGANVKVDSTTGERTPVTLEAPIVAIICPDDGNGYWLIGSDGGVFAYGSAQFRGIA